MARGSARVNGKQLEQGDALILSQESAVKVEAAKQAELLLFDLA